MVYYSHRQDFPVLLRQYRKELVQKMRSQFFRQIVQKFRRHNAVWQGISVQDSGKYASKFCAKPSGGLCAVLPLFYEVVTMTEINVPNKKTEKKHHGYAFDYDSGLVVVWG